ncbi:MAG: GNAT family N-acetyltransferase [Synergistaceae bacterium]|nr:GNAT family N-acetyltransferase [Synergistaceae bacterium]
MCELDIFKENFFSTMMMLGKNPAGSLTVLPSGSLVSMSGLPSEDDNYVLFNSLTTQCEVKKSLDLFNKQKVPFVAPEFPDLGEQLPKMLESLGLHTTNNYTAMYLSDKNKTYVSDTSCVEITSLSEAETWAIASWMGFEGKTPVSESYVDFTKYLISRRENKLFILKDKGIAVCSGLLCYSNRACGLYSFSTLPEYRRRGFAKLLMNSMAAVAFRSHNIFVLLATEEGVPFYENFGFLSLANIPIRTLKIKA